MRSWPAGLLTHYPSPYAAVRERPWWMRQGEFTVERVDGFQVTLCQRFRDNKAAYLALFTSLPPQRGKVRVFSPDVDYPNATPPEERECLIVGTMEKIDQEHALPHPGFRAGQVWAFDTQEGMVVATLYADTRLARIIDGSVGLSFSECIPLREWHGSKRSAAVFEASEGMYPAIDELLGLTAYLLADPVCPWLAPWAPV